ncbi:nucleoside triphosphate pyrophosphatase [uncultured Intestinimonas sp.]|uniref:Maf family protein n=1 Tax=uncultured Intestinimonas sp. TaxID=1689265 RepID=UPI0025DAE05C|nr:Maf family protein [uncultured Intestinimonas sp.]
MGLILASGSPRRRQLLEQIGLTFVVRSSDVDESVSPGLTPAQVVESLSARKGEAVAAEAAPGDLVLSADTVVALDGAILGKPRDRAEAEAMLTALSGRTHQVYTGVTLLQDGRRLTEHEVTAVTFRPLSPGEIAAYVSTGEPMDKAGAYGIQGLGALLVERLEGDYFNVMGLPLCRLGEMLAQFGVRPLEAAGLRRE